MSLYTNSSTSAFDDAMKVPLFPKNSKASSSSGITWDRDNTGKVSNVILGGNGGFASNEQPFANSSSNRSGLHNKRIQQLLYSLSRSNDKCQTLSRCLSLSLLPVPRSGANSGQKNYPQQTHFSTGGLNDLRSTLKESTALMEEIHGLFKSDSEYLIGSRRQREIEMGDPSAGSDNLENTLRTQTTQNTMTDSSIISTASQYFQRVPREERQVHSRLRRDFQKEVGRLENHSKSFAQMEKQYEQEVKQKNPSAASQPSWNTSSSSGGSHSPVPDDFPLGTSVQLVQEESLHTSRREEITNIQQSMQKVHEIYQDLGNLVEEQQYEVDDIEANIQASHVRTEHGMKQLVKGAKLQRNTTKCVSWMLIFIVVAAVVCIGILYGNDFLKK